MKKMQDMKVEGNRTTNENSNKSMAGHENSG